MRLFVRRPSRLGALVTSLGLAAAIAAPMAAPAPVEAAEPDFPTDMSGYHNLPEMVAEIQAAAAAYPETVSLFSIGKSYQGRDIWMAKVSDNVATDENEPEVLVDALHHAREHMTTEQALALLRWLTQDYATDAAVKRLVDARETFIIFALNPDGMRYDLTGSPFRAWRKNRQPNAGTTAVGTDLNRNYSYRWGCCGGSSGSPSSITYRGPAPFSAPETKAMRDFVNSRVVNGVQQIRAHITLHTNGELILYPYGYTKTNMPGDMTNNDYRAFVALAREQAARNGYVAQQSSDLYITDGDQIDWMYGTHRIFSFTYELYPPETATVWGDHYPDDSRIAAQTARNRSAILRLIDRSWCPWAALGTDYVRTNCGPLYDDLEINRAWKANPDGTDTATAGVWAVANPAATSSNGPKQLGTVVSGSKALVTGPAAGAATNTHDLDGGRTSVRSRPVRLPADPDAIGPLTFRYSFAHDARGSAQDAFRLLIEAEDGTRTKVFERLGRAADVDAVWAHAAASVKPWAGQTIRLVFEATDGGAGNLVEAAVDDVRIRRP
jgi:carboxypeptidase T